MKGKEIAVDVLLGAILLTVFAVSFLAVLAAVHLVFYAVDLGVRYFFPAVTHPWEVDFYTFISIALLAVCARQLRKRLWANAFLSLAALITIIMPWLLNPQPHHISAGTALRFPVAWFVAFLIPRDTRAQRNEFMTCGAILALAFACNAGLLGSGALSTIVGIGLSVAVAAWILVSARDGRLEWASWDGILSRTGG